MHLGLVVQYQICDNRWTDETHFLVIFNLFLSILHQAQPCFQSCSSKLPSVICIFAPLPQSWLCKQSILLKWNCSRAKGTDSESVIGCLNLQRICTYIISYFLHSSKSPNPNVPLAMINTLSQYKASQDDNAWLGPGWYQVISIVQSTD